MFQTKGAWLDIDGDGQGGCAIALKPRRHRNGDRLLTRADLPSDTASLARYLIGKIVVRELSDGIVSGRIVETEAYVVGDAAGHAYRGMTPRNGSLFLERGHAYIYFAYGSSYMLNVSSEARGIGAGVLIRALEPVEGIPIMRVNRGIERLRDLARGPGRLAAALRIDRQLDGLDLCRKGPLWLGRDDHEPGDIGQSIRIGISRDADRPLRFYFRDNPFVSGSRSLNQ
ncbi:DNA-3-methyladenine glycosylase [Hyphomicrobium sp. ghe19]|uniref:DNA-3-methyladenine glycosylase n=1 Tax=Hyphomicrobium sp. ghe19 TaxID=2682968 RepID=UPI0013676089|nr:Putative 3-methyladenine DNA glycosylase [Hyphomicrobium sp. ghe19]